MVQSRSNFPFGKAVQTGLVAALGAGAANAVIYLIASGLGLMPTSVLTPMGQPITLGPVLILSVLSSLGAAAVYWLLSRFLANPRPAFFGAAALVFVALFIGPFNLPGAPAAMIWSLQLMHLVAAAIPIYLLALRR